VAEWYRLGEVKRYQLFLVNADTSPSNYHLLLLMRPPILGVIDQKSSLISTLQAVNASALELRRRCLDSVCVGQRDLNHTIMATIS
jgi:hypothetical protein